MDIVFEHNPRKKLDRAYVEQELARRTGISGSSPMPEKTEDEV